MNQDRDPERIRSAADEACGPLLPVQRVFEAAQRYFLTPQFPQLEDKLEKASHLLTKCRQTLETTFKNASSPHLSGDEGWATILSAVSLFSEAVDLIRSDASTHNIQEIIKAAMAAYRKYCRAHERLFPLRLQFPAIDALFLENPKKAPPKAIEDETPTAGEALFHVGVETGHYARGAFSIFVSGGDSASALRPLVIALHGGFGHGRDFIWTWLREARSRNFLLLAPTSTGDTWSITQPETDLGLLRSAIAHVKERWPVDDTRVLLTGISDGGTFALMGALAPEPVFSHVAVIAGTLPPADFNPASGKKIMWIHGALDWMFPVNRAQFAASMLTQAGADIRLNILPNLAHAYPREQNPHILDWFMK